MMGKTALSRTIAAGCLAAVMAGCGAGRAARLGADAPLESFSAEQIYERGEFELARNQHEEAAGSFAEVERLYPYSEWAERALVMQAFAWHEEGNYDEARAAAQRYLDFYPATEGKPYAQHLLALS